jgi:hypothetical protein
MKLFNVHLFRVYQGKEYYLKLTLEASDPKDARAQAEAVLPVEWEITAVGVDPKWRNMVAEMVKGQ